MNTNRRTKRVMSEINVVPYIDVMLVLLVIFMITTPLLTQGVNVNLPQASAKTLDSETKEPIVVSVDATGLYYLNVGDNIANPISANELVTRITAELQLAQEQGQHRPVLIKGDKNVDYGKVVTAMVYLQQAGVNNIGLVTESPETN